MSDAVLYTESNIPGCLKVYTTEVTTNQGHLQEPNALFMDKYG